MPKDKSHTILLIIFASVAGFLSGIIGFVLIDVNRFNLPLIGRLNFSDIDAGRQIVIDQPRNVIVEQDLQLKQVENSALPTLINIYLPKKSSDPLEQAYMPTEAIGQGFVLTADGWVVLGSRGAVNLKNKYVAVGYQMKNYDLSGFIKDEVTGIIFGRVAAKDLPVVHLGKSSLLSAGQTVVLVGQRQSVTLAYIKSIGYDIKTRNDLVQSTEHLNKEIFLNFDLDNSYNGSMLVNLKGEVLGIVDSGRVIPVDYFKNIVSQVLENQKIIRPVLGVNYIDLSHTEGLIGYTEDGALVINQPLRTSPAYSIIKVGDVIKKVDGVELNNFHSLSEVLLDYKTGDRPELLVRRQGQELKVVVDLR